MAEQDPNGLDAHTPGAKLDAGKQRPFLVLGSFLPALRRLVGKTPDFGVTIVEYMLTPCEDALLHATRSCLPTYDSTEELMDDVLSNHLLCGVVDVGTFGAAKYAPDGWMQVPDAYRRYRDAALRHQQKMLKGELRDADSGLPHVDHRNWNLLAALTISLRDDIP